ncbi:hypothetical protein BASA61_003044 [Batrachochytrium salamandrivorans]|nr:hypothetical protein BASA61_003044 [Batrachochytrium salamandrivorans]
MRSNALPDRAGALFYPTPSSSTTGRRRSSRGSNTQAGITATDTTHLSHNDPNGFFSSYESHSGNHDNNNDDNNNNNGDFTGMTTNSTAAAAARAADGPAARYATGPQGVANMADLHPAQSSVTQVSSHEADPKHPHQCMSLPVSITHNEFL